MHSLSPQLIAKAKAYFSSKLCRAVLDDEAEQFLLSITKIYDVFAEEAKKKPARVPRPQARRHAGGAYYPCL